MIKADHDCHCAWQSCSFRVTFFMIASTAPWNIRARHNMLQEQTTAPCNLFASMAREVISMEQLIDVVLVNNDLYIDVVGAAPAANEKRYFDLTHQFGEWLAQHTLVNGMRPETVLTYLMKKHQERSTMYLAKEGAEYNDSVDVPWHWAWHRTLGPWNKARQNSSFSDIFYYANIFHAYVWSLPLTLWMEYSLKEITDSALSICRQFDNPLYWECYHGMGHMYFSFFVHQHVLDTLIDACTTFSSLQDSGRGLSDALLASNISIGMMAQPCEAASTRWKVISCCHGLAHSIAMHTRRTALETHWLELNKPLTLKQARGICPE